MTDASQRSTWRLEWTKAEAKESAPDIRKEVASGLASDSEKPDLEQSGTGTHTWRERDLLPVRSCAFNTAKPLSRLPSSAKISGEGASFRQQCM